MFRVLVEEVFVAVAGNGPPHEPLKRFEQCIDALDIRAVIEAVNRKPRKPREARTGNTPGPAKAEVKK